jgi:hypothetical protein
MSGRANAGIPHCDHLQNQQTRTAARRSGAKVLVSVPAGVPGLGEDYAGARICSPPRRALAGLAAAFTGSAGRLATALVALAETTVLVFALD